ncbi:MAG TPA: DUF6624 domain-containing protein [Jiangellales bacterium]|nr:DUF6624 domain-containing protein [Jiangellales bacterium]
MRISRLASVLVVAVAMAATTTSCASEPTVQLNPELQAELVEMQAADQAERTGQSSEDGDRERTERLTEIIDEFGWPTRSLVGTDGATAAWVIAQHSDQDVEFQERALELMREAVTDDEADPTELAYLEDRVATNRGEPQIYGTQIGCVDGEAVPGPIADEANVDERRADAGLQPLDEYLAELAELCAEEAENQ